MVASLPSCYLATSQGHSTRITLCFGSMIDFDKHILKAGLPKDLLGIMELKRINNLP